MIRLYSKDRNKQINPYERNSDNYGNRNKKEFQKDIADRVCFSRFAASRDVSFDAYIAQNVQQHHRRRLRRGNC